MAFTQPPMGPPVGNPMGAQNQAANPDALMQELAVLAQRAQEIMAQLQSMGVDPTQMAGAEPMGASGVPVDAAPMNGLLAV